MPKSRSTQAIWQSNANERKVRKEDQEIVQEFNLHRGERTWKPFKEIRVVASFSRLEPESKGYSC